MKPLSLSTVVICVFSILICSCGAIPKKSSDENSANLEALVKAKDRKGVRDYFTENSINADHFEEKVVNSKPTSFGQPQYGAFTLDYVLKAIDSAESQEKIEKNQVAETATKAKADEQRQVQEVEKAKQNEKEEFTASDDPRCAKKYWPGVTQSARGQTVHVERLYKRIGVSETVAENEMKKAGRWLEYVLNSGPYQMKSTSKPQFLIGKLNPIPKTGGVVVPKVHGIPMDQIFDFWTPNGERAQFVFKNQKKVTCGWVALYPEKWKAVGGEILVLESYQVKPQ